MSVLLFSKCDSEYLEDPDLSGPVLIVLALGILPLFVYMQLILIDRKTAF
jgi:hypothetical protein